ncbi:COG1361 S-layer family protein [Halocalculus aciditolerans]|uniref:CARDB domain-containing protein n=1 Tax=Halocalculus aciditolerans TaxID=1383812 RepID=A0A830FKC2_9EURY|nr:COG1361 S-layer family protein [Halocalculus aciditolerans]GGL60869.1 hypothetical protein GCM10009039_18860 [Halocalculus aciditolerans]
MRKKLITLVLVACLLVSSGAATGLVRGQPDLNATLPNSQVAPGEDAQLTVQLSNGASLDYVDARSAEATSTVTTAKAVRASLKSDDAPIEVNSGTVSVGSVPDGGLKTAQFDISVKPGAEPGTYKLPVKLHYDYTYQYDASENIISELSRTETAYVKVEVKDAPRFEVVDSKTNVSVGDTGDVSLTLRNVGSAAANASHVAVQSTSSAFAVGTSGSVSQFTGDWQPGENRTVVVSASAAGTANPAPYTFRSAVTYENEDGQTREADPAIVGVAPQPEQTFDVSNVQSELRVGEDGNVTARVTNAGPRAADHVVVHVAASADGVVPKSSEYAVGSLDAGAATTVDFPIQVSSAAESGPHQLDFSVTYQNPEGDTRESDSLPAEVPISGERDAFLVQPQDVNVTAGGSAEITLEVTNNMDEPVSNVNAKIFTNSPLSANDDTAFTTALDPDESTTMTFDVGASGSAIEKNYPLRMDFQYENAQGEQTLSDTYQVPVQVTVPEGGGLPVVPIVAVILLLVAAVGGYYYWNRD